MAVRENYTMYISISSPWASFSLWFLVRLGGRQSKEACLLQRHCFPWSLSPHNSQTTGITIETEKVITAKGKNRQAFTWWKAPVLCRSLFPYQCVFPQFKTCMHLTRSISDKTCILFSATRCFTLASSYHCDQGQIEILTVVFCFGQ